MDLHLSYINVFDMLGMLPLIFQQLATQVAINTWTILNPDDIPCLSICSYRLLGMALNFLLRLSEKVAEHLLLSISNNRDHVTNTFLY